MVSEHRLRDPVSGQFAFDGGFDRVCRCGHTLGVHVSGGFECVNADTGDGAHCACVKFRPVRQARAGTDRPSRK